MEKVVALAMELVKHFEGFRSKPYLCPAGVWTIGYGSTRYEDGRKVAKDDPEVSRDYAEYLAKIEVERCAKKVLKYAPVLAYHEEKWAAISDFSYNLGIGRFQASTLIRRINEEAWEEAAYELGKWVYGGGRIQKGLIRRRISEKILFSEGRIVLI